MPAPKDPTQNLSRRERQAMDVIYGLEQATAKEVLEKLPDPPSYSSVRSMLRLLEEKGLLTHSQEGQRYVFRPTVGRTRAGKTALQHLVSTFFGGSTGEAVASLLNLEDAQLDTGTRKRILAMIQSAEERGA